MTHPRRYGRAIHRARRRHGRAMHRALRNHQARMIAGGMRFVAATDPACTLIGGWAYQPPVIEPGMADALRTARDLLATLPPVEG